MAAITPILIRRKFKDSSALLAIFNETGFHVNCFNTINLGLLLKTHCAKAEQFAILPVFIDLFFLNRTALFYYVLLFRNIRFGNGLRGVFVLSGFPCLDFYLLQIPVRLVDFAAEFFDLIVNVGAAASRRPSAAAIKMPIARGQSLRAQRNPAGRQKKIGLQSSSLRRLFESRTPTQSPKTAFWKPRRKSEPPPASLRPLRKQFA